MGAKTERALARAARGLLEKAGRSRHPRGLKGLSETRDAWAEEGSAEQWRDRFAACFDTEERPSFERYLQSAFKEMGGVGSAKSSMDLLDCAQAQLLARGAWEPALGLEALREAAEREAGAALSSHGLARGSAQSRPSAWREQNNAQTPLELWLCSMLRNARFCAASEETRSEHWFRAAQGGREISLSRQQLDEARAFELLGMDQSMRSGGSPLAMDLARQCHDLARDAALDALDAEREPCAITASLASFAGRLCVRLLRAGGDGAWLFDAHGVVWDGECALMIEGQGAEEPLPEFWSGMEQESINAPSARGARSKSKAL